VQHPTQRVYQDLDSETNELLEAPGAQAPRRMKAHSAGCQCIACVNKRRSQERRALGASADPAAAAQPGGQQAADGTPAAPKPEPEDGAGGGGAGKQEGGGSSSEGEEDEDGMPPPGAAQSAAAEAQADQPGDQRASAEPSAAAAGGPLSSGRPRRNKRKPLTADFSGTEQSDSDFDAPAGGGTGGKAAAAAGGPARAAPRPKGSITKVLTTVTAGRFKDRLDILALLRSGSQQLGRSWTCQSNLVRHKKDMPVWWDGRHDMGGWRAGADGGGALQTSVCCWLLLSCCCCPVPRAPSCCISCAQPATCSARYASAPASCTCNTTALTHPTPSCPPPCRPGGRRA
jgi:hypothetical protein